MSEAGVDISVILPARDALRYLPAAAESVLAQTGPDFELIVVDDGSRDGTGEWLDRAARADTRVLAIRQPPTGIVPALNRGIAEARGAYIARMDADDLMRPSRLARQAAFLDEHSGIGLVASRAAYLGDARRNRGLALFVQWTNTLTRPEDISLYRFVESPFVHPSVMFRRELIERHGPYRDGPFPEDYELWLRWMDCGVRMAKLEDVLLDWRDRPDRLTRTDPRYSAEAFYRTKAPFLYRWLAAHNRFHPDVIVWGAGRTSRKRLRFLMELGIRVEAYVDIDPRKIGYRVHGAEVIPPERLPAPGRCFVLPWVASRGARAEIEEDLQRRGFRRGADYLPCA